MAKPREIMGASVPLSGGDVQWYTSGDTGITKDHSQEVTSEVPVWVNGLQRWVTGVDRKTTCDDVIKVLLGSDPSQQQHPGWSGHRVPDDLHHRYAIVERWRKVERPLDGRSRILKVWSAWGDAQRDVKLALRRRIPGTQSSATGALSSVTKETARRRRHHHHHHEISREMSAKTIHPKRFHSKRDDGERYHFEKEAPWTDDSDKEGCEYLGVEPKFTDTMEKLMKLILAQGETIQAQLKKLREREDQIDHFEHEVHRLRVKNHGSNYLLDTYLKGVDAEGVDAEEEEEREEGECEEEGSKGEDSGVVTEGGSGDGSGDPPPPSEIHGKYRILDENTITTESRHRNGKEGLRVKATSESKDLSCPSGESSIKTSPKDIQAHIELWEKVLKVNKKLEKTEECLVKLHVKLRQHSRDKSPARIPKVSQEEEERLQRELEWTRAELEKVAVHSNGVDRELQKNEEALANADEWLEVRNRVLEGLELELDVAEKESEALTRRKDELTISSSVQRPPPQYSHPPPAPISPKCPHQRPIREDVPINDKGIGVTVTPNSTVPMRKIMEKDSHDTDSNSDTGLSSLHSSSEEGGYVLDTLV